MSDSPDLHPKLEAQAARLHRLLFLGVPSVRIRIMIDERKADDGQPTRPTWEAIECLEWLLVAQDPELRTVPRRGLSIDTDPIREWAARCFNAYRAAWQEAKSIVDEEQPKPDTETGGGRVTPWG